MEIEEDYRNVNQIMTDPFKIRNYLYQTPFILNNRKIRFLSKTLLRTNE